MVVSTLGIHPALTDMVILHSNHCCDQVSVNEYIRSILCPHCVLSHIYWDAHSIGVTFQCSIPHVGGMK